MIDVNLTYCGNYFTIYVSQIIMLYSLNLYSAVCQLYPSKTGKKFPYQLGLYCYPQL